MYYDVKFKGEFVTVSLDVLKVLSERLVSRRKINSDILYYSNYDLVGFVDNNFVYDSFENFDLKLALNSLSKDEFTLINMLYFHGYSQSQVAVFLNVSQSVISRRCDKILAKLKLLLLEVI